MTAPIAFAAPVDVGMIFSAAALPLRIFMRFFQNGLVVRVGMNRRHHAAADAECLIQHLDYRRQAVRLQDALEMIWSVSGL